MKFLNYLFIFLTLFLGISSTAKLKSTVEQYVQSGNLLENPGFENGKAKWSASGGVFTLESGFFNSKKAFSWDPSAASQTFDSELVTIGEGVAGGLCGIEVKKYKWVGGTKGQLKLVVRYNDVSEGTEVDFVELELSPTVGAETIPAILNFTCPDEPTDKLRFRLEALSDQPAIVGDNAHLGLATNLTKVSDEGGVAFVRFPIVAGCTPLRTNVAFGAFGDDPECPAPIVEYAYQPIDASDNNNFDLSFTSLKQGKYKVNFKGPIDIPLGVAGGVRIAADNITQTVPECSLTPPNESGTTVTNGRAWVSCSAFFDNLTTQPVTFSIHGFSASGNILIHGELGSVTWSVDKVSGANKNVLSYETSGFESKGSIGGNNITLSGPLSSDWTKLESSLLTLNQTKGQPQIACSGSEESSGTVCSGNGSIGFSEILPAPGNYDVCFTLPVEYSTVNASLSAQVFVTGRVVHTENSSQVVKSASKPHSGPSESATNANSLGGGVFDICDTFYIATAGKNTFRFEHTYSITASNSNIKYLFDRSSTVGIKDRAVYFSIKKSAERGVQLIDPDFTDALNKKSDKNTAAIDYSGGVPSVIRESRDWVDGNPVDNGVGDITLNFVNGIFDGATVPECFCETIDVNFRSCNLLPTPTSVRVTTWNTGTSTRADTAFSIRCD